MIGVRWLIRRDMPEVLMIEQAVSDFPWTEDDFLTALRERNRIGMVAEGMDGTVDGFIIYELHKNSLGILNMAVRPRRQKTGVGALMIGRLVEKLYSGRRTQIDCLVSERNTSVQAFLKSQGFRARQLVRDHYPDGDGFLMRFDLNDDGEDIGPTINRVWKFIERARQEDDDDGYTDIGGEGAMTD